MKPSILLSGLGTALLLTGCQTLDRVGAAVASIDVPWMSKSTITIPQQTGCPAVARVPELSSMYQFVDPQNPSDKSLISEVQLTRVTSTCKTQGRNLKLDITANFDGALGPKAKNSASDKPSFAYPYFVAIVNGQNQILMKEIFAVSFAYDSKANQQQQVETISQTVPLGAGPASTYRILVGFQLEESELAYNRALPPQKLGKSLTLTTVGTPPK